MDQTLIFDSELIQRYDRAGPRYTSYPTAVQFHEAFGEREYRHAAACSNQETPVKPLSLYFHLPFCDTVCYYCACNKIITRNRKRAAPYLQTLYQEMALQGQLFDSQRLVDQLHWGGGTPTFLSHGEMRDLMQHTAANFSLRQDDAREYSIEIDPREADVETVALLAQLGFNRMSLGVQDFDPMVQQAVNRLQSQEETQTVLEAARDYGFHSINLDLIYGLPKQTVASFERTLEKVIAMNPDRLSVFNYAHMPALFKTQRQINAQDLPSPAEKLAILQAAITRLTEAGYVYIGMDHFARPEDELALAQRQGGLYRNFQGYSTHAECDLVAMGMTSISKVGASYSQNLRSLDTYSTALASGRLPVQRGVVLDTDDQLRRAVIMALMCHFELDIRAIEMRFRIVFSEYFAPELAALGTMQADGLVRVNSEHLQVQPVGKLLIRNIAMVFDRYLRTQTDGRYSRVI